MARAWNKLSANFIRTASDGRHGDGGGLYLQVGNGGRAWVFLYARNRVSRAMGLGAARSVSLAVARELAAEAREQLARGVDPIDARKAAMQAQQAARAKLITFKACTEEFYEGNKARWNSAKHRNEWISSLRRLAFPLIGHLSVNAIDSGHVQKVLTPLVTTKAITAARLRGRIESVLDYATAGGRRSGENPARKEVMAHLVPLQSEKATVKHLAALPYAMLPQFMKALRATEGTDARLLEMIVLTNMRSDAVRCARRTEFSGDTWSIPKNRMKRLKRDHDIPLGGRAVEIVTALRGGGDFLFGGAKPIGKGQPWKLLPDLLKAIGHDAPVTVHGFRSTFKDWCHEERDYRTEVIEQSLGHRIKSSVERAYRRGQLLKKRQILMDDWENFCAGRDSSTVVALHAA